MAPELTVHPLSFLDNQFNATLRYITKDGRDRTVPFGFKKGYGRKMLDIAIQTAIADGGNANELNQITMKEDEQ